MSSNSAYANEEEEPERVCGVRVACQECGKPVTDDTLERLWVEEQILVKCLSCNGIIVLKLSNLDKVAEGLIFTVQEFKALERRRSDKSSYFSKSELKSSSQ